MIESILVPVHVGYAVNKEEVSDIYGNYGEYLSRLQDAVRSQSSMIFPFRDHKLPFELPNGTESIPDWSTTEDRDSGTRKLISRLKEKGVRSVDVCGEFLWQYRHFGGDYDENRRRAYENLSEEGKAEFIDNIVKSAIEENVDPIERLNKLIGKAVTGGCVKAVYDALSKEFHVELRRDLCYPTIEPEQLSIEDLAKHIPNIATAEYLILP